LCKNNLENVFYSSEKPNYLLYVHRIEQVRKEQEEKMKQANVRLPKNDNPKWINYTRRVFNNSEYDSEVLFDKTQKIETLSIEDVKRSLHNKLHSNDTI
jgi:predicted lipase